MNYSMIFYVYCVIMEAEAGFMLLPLTCSLVYRDGCAAAFLIPILALAALGSVGILRKPKDQTIFAREGFIIVAGAWIIVSAFGSLPFMISGYIPSFIDAFFETVSGFTTTGASILRDVEALSYSLLFWRSFTHWVGGMGVLVFVMAIVPLSGGRGIYLMRAESPGPSVGKLLPSMKSTAKILYTIYIGITVLEVIFLCLGGMPLFDSLVNSFGSVGTGGFAIKNASIAAYASPYCEMVITVFMTLCGINFTLFYFIIAGQALQAFKSEELRVYLGIIVAATLLIAVNISGYYDSFLECLRYAVFQVTSIITTTGFTTTDYGRWPELSKTILLILMVLGACAGSTGGGLKISRLVMLMKSIVRDIRHSLHPRSVQLVHFDGKPVEEQTITGVGAYFTLYVLLTVLSILVVSLDGKSLETTLSGVLACFNNIGPGLGECGPVGNYADFSVISKLTLTVDMLFGRLELIPLIMLLSPGVWKRKYKYGGSL